MEYASLLSEDMQKTLQKAGYESPTPIQEESLAPLLEGRDLIGLAQTGTGKTAAFGIPIIERIDRERRDTQCLVLCPTRELAVQTTNVFKMLAERTKLRTVSIYGGQSINVQIRALKSGAEIVVGTPGRVRDLLGRKELSLASLTTVVLDEADEMLDYGFLPDIRAILGQIKQKHQTLLFSATMTEDVGKIADRFLHDPITIEIGKRNEPVNTVQQFFIHADENIKAYAVREVMKQLSPKLTLIFCNTRSRVRSLTRTLNAIGVKSDCLHGELTQSQRDAIMKAFRDGKLSVLVATDVAARGIDVELIDLVINYDVPDKPEYYVHRIGRTGRAGNCGSACTLIGGPEDKTRLAEIRRLYHIEGAI